MPRGIEDFAGTWQLAKVIADRRGPDATFDGTARVEGQGADWAYVEAGTLRIGAAALTAERRNLWTPTDGGIAVAFDGGRHFHVLPLAAGQAVHDCPPDFYRVTYDFAGWPLSWTARWRVTGPCKDYEMTCTYRR